MKLKPLAVALINKYHDHFGEYPAYIKLSNMSEAHELEEELAGTYDCFVEIETSNGKESVTVTHDVTSGNFWSAYSYDTENAGEGEQASIHKKFSAPRQVLEETAAKQESLSKLHETNSILNRMLNRYTSVMNNPPDLFTLPCSACTTYFGLRGNAYLGIEVQAGDDWSAVGRKNHPALGTEIITFTWANPIKEKT